MLSTLVLAVNLLVGQGLTPFAPPSGAQIATELRDSPNDRAIIVRRLEPTDKIRYLRSLDNWFEADIQSADGLSFRGWLKGALPSEKTAPPPPPVQTASSQRENQPSILDSDKYFWVWSGKITDRGLFRFNLGMQDITYQLKGLVDGAEKKIYNYDFLGIGLDAQVRLALLQFPLWKGVFFWTFGASYNYGLFRLTFSPDFVIGELRGKGYSITTHTYDLETTARYLHKFKNDLELLVGLGPTYYLHEVSPDLESSQSFKQAIFGDVSVSGISLTTLSLDLNYKNKFEFGLRFVPLMFLSDISEDAVDNPSLTTSGFGPTLYQLLFGYRFAERWSLSAKVDYFSASGESKGDGSRLNQAYTDGKINISSLKGSLGFKYNF